MYSYTVLCCLNNPSDCYLRTSIESCNIPLFNFAPTFRTFVHKWQCTIYWPQIPTQLVPDGVVLTRYLGRIAQCAISGVSFFQRVVSSVISQYSQNGEHSYRPSVRPVTLCACLAASSCYKLNGLGEFSGHYQM
jgi:hypothetical protein